MRVDWSFHAKERWLEKFGHHGIYFQDVEDHIIVQKIRILEGEGKFRTIFKIGNSFVTAIKIEKEKKIKVITIWASNSREVLIWKNASSNASAAEKQT
ncbi:MAG TPA: hypothetical protein VJH23_02340 [archaeon]|nr:hypothetical protein [archaeon]